MPTETLLTNGLLVLADSIQPGSLVLRDGRIAEIAPGPAGAGAVDLDGDLLLPGLVEIHTDNVEKHLAPRPGVAWPSASALLAHDAQVATAGITTVLDAVCIGEVPGRDWRDVAEALVPTLHRLTADGLLRSEHFLHLRCELPDPGLESAFAAYGDDPRVRLVSLMDHTPGQRQFTDVERYVRFQVGFGHDEARVRQTLAESFARQDRFADRHRRLIGEACRAAGIPLASHDDEKPNHVAEAKALGVALSEFPTTTTAAAAARSHGLLTALGAPNVVRGGSHSGNASALDLARDGLLDILSSDYMPAGLLAAAFLLAEKAGMDLPAAVATVSRTPARLLGFADRGEIAVGLRADLVRVRPTAHGPVVRAVWREGERVA